jgi:hypothetical protein
VAVDHGSSVEALTPRELIDRALPLTSAMNGSGRSPFGGEVSAYGAGTSFSAALENLKAGRRVARTGWNGRGMWLVLVHGDNVPTRDEGVYLAPGSHVGFPPDVGRWVDEIKSFAPWIGMKSADGSFVPWLASQTDLLAEDWVEVTP